MAVQKRENWSSPLTCFSWLVSTQHSCGLRSLGKSSVLTLSSEPSNPSVPLGILPTASNRRRLWCLSVFVIYNEGSHLVWVLFAKEITDAFSFLFQFTFLGFFLFLQKTAYELAPIWLVFTFESLVLRLFHQRVNLSRNNSGMTQSIMSFWLLAGMMLEGCSSRRQ